MTASLLRTKLHIPFSRSKLLSRPRLIQKLDEGLSLDHRLTLVSAPAGFGKTTLLSEWMAGCRHPGAWVSLDERDNDPTRFWSYFSAAVRVGCGETIETVLTETANMDAAPIMSPPHRSPSVETLLTSLINETSAQERKIIVALDDFHVIESPAICDALAFFLDRSPAQIHLALATRADPPLPLGRLRARGEMTELRAGDLRFTGEETAAFLRQIMGLDLSPEDIATLENRTEGWIVGLQLAALSLLGREQSSDLIAAFNGRQRFVMDYLFEEVLRQQDEPIRNFLYQTSVLDRMTAPLCNAVAGRNDSDRLLERLEQANLFLVPLDDRREWFRYHHLFSDFLRSQAAAQSQGILRAKAAQWLMENGFPGEAVKYALSTGKEELAIRSIQSAAPEALRHGEVSTLLGWLDALPEATVRSDFWLAAFKGWALEMMGQIDAAESYVDSLPEIPPDKNAPSKLGYLTTVKAYLAYDRRDWPKAAALFRKALDSHDERDATMHSAMLVGLAQALYATGDVDAASRTFHDAFDCGLKGANYHAGFSALIQLTWIRLEQGQRQEVATLCEQAIHLCVDSRKKPLPIAGLAYIGLGQASYSANELAQARQQLLSGIGLLTGTHFRFQSLWGNLMLAQVDQGLGETDAARSRIQEAIQSVEYRSYRNFIKAYEADLNSRTGNIVAAEHWLAANFSPEKPPQPWQRILILMVARVCLARGQIHEARKVLDRLEPVLRKPDALSQLLPGGLLSPLTGLLILQSLASQMAGHEDAALIKLEEALHQAAPEGCRRVFLEEGAMVARLLPRLRPAEPAFVDQLLQDFEEEAQRHRNRTSAQPLVEPLTHREIEVLCLIEDGLRNQEIADRLVISVDTVKRHVYNVYRKLGVTHRTQAIAHARELHLL